MYAVASRLKQALSNVGYPIIYQAGRELSPDQRPQQVKHGRQVKQRRMKQGQHGLTQGPHKVHLSSSQGPHQV